jgi:WD40 repeat protein
MLCCINPHCPTPDNADGVQVCQSCGTPITLLRGRYQTVELLGHGGFGRTYLALDGDRLNARCVIKQFSPRVQNPKGMETAVRLFNQEAVRLHELGEHAQIPTLLAYFEQADHLYLVQQFIEGQSLLQQMRQQGSFSEQQIRNVLADVLPVLRFIHRHQVIHRDITPMNVLRRQSDDRLVLIDFGVAKQLDENALGGEAGTRVGTEGYMPMEQFRGGKAYPASDIYSLGATCLHLLTGNRPDHLYDPLQGRWVWREYLQQQKNIVVSNQLAHILDQMLKDLVADRYQSADEVMRDLNADSFMPVTTGLTIGGTVNPAKSSTMPPQSPPSATVPLRSATLAAPPSHPPVVPPSNTPLSRAVPSKPPIPQSSTSQFNAPPSPVARAATGKQTTGQTTGRTAGQTASPVSRPVSGSIAATRSPDSSQQGRMLTLKGHASWITCVVLNSVTQTLISSSLDDSIKVWNLNTGKELLTLKGHTRAVNSIALAPDGNTLVSGSDDYTIKVWNIQTGALLGTLRGHARDVNAIVISANGKFLCSGGEDRTIRLWHMGTGALLKTFSEVAGMIKALAISPDSQLLASGGLDNKIRLWNFQTGELIQSLIGHMGFIHTVAFSSDSQVLASGSRDRTIKLWSRKTGELINTLTDHGRDVNSLSFAPNGKYLISGSSDATIKLWELASGKLVHTWTGHTDSVNTIAISSDGRTLVSGSSDKTIKVWA